MPNFFFYTLYMKKIGVREKNSCTPIFYAQKKGVKNVARKYRRLGYEDRRIIERMCKEKKSVATIAAELGVHRDTIYKEFARAGTSKNEYSAEMAQRAI